jgi:hypothetical protein
MTMTAPAFTPGTTYSHAALAAEYGFLPGYFNNSRGMAISAERDVQLLIE